jgi:hypothetical protein
VFENRSRESPALHQCIRTSGHQVTEGITPDVVHHERLPDIVVSTAIVELPNIEWIQRRHDVDVAVGVQAEGVQRCICKPVIRLKCTPFRKPRRMRTSPDSCKSRFSHADRAESILRAFEILAVRSIQLPFPLQLPFLVASAAVIGSPDLPNKPLANGTNPFPHDFVFFYRASSTAFLLSDR